MLGPERAVLLLGIRRGRSDSIDHPVRAFESGRSHLLDDVVPVEQRRGLFERPVLGWIEAKWGEGSVKCSSGKGEEVRVAEEGNSLSTQKKYMNTNSNASQAK